MNLFGAYVFSWLWFSGYCLGLFPVGFVVCYMDFCLILFVLRWWYAGLRCLVDLVLLVGFACYGLGCGLYVNFLC